MKKKSVVVITIFSILIIGAIVAYIALSNFLTKSYYQQTFLMEDESMEPAIAKGDKLKSDRQYENLQRGDIVVVNSLIDNQPIVRRVIGLPHENVEFSSEKMTIRNSASPSGFVLAEPYIQGTPARTRFSWTLKENEYLVLADNRSESNDSSKFGPINSSRILAKIVNLE